MAKANSKPSKSGKVKKAPKLSAKEKRALERDNVATLGAASPYYRTWLRSHLRKYFRRWPSYQQLSSASPTKKMLGVSKRGTKMMLKHKQCSICKEWFVLKDLAQDHEVPCGSLLSVEPEEVGQFVLNMHCAVSNLRWVCDYTLDEAKARFNGKKSCHYTLTYGDK